MVYYLDNNSEKVSIREQVLLRERNIQMFILPAKGSHRSTSARLRVLSAQPMEPCVLLAEQHCVLWETPTIRRDLT